MKWLRLKTLTADETEWLTLCRYVGVPEESGLRLYKLLNHLQQLQSPPTETP